ncbi:cerebellin-3-like isoform X2 [Pristis pectinata]|uniref:cerebellin-3-like isoform X2 n=1 Tax=Pristis pectinata TaxID=685728 RepID=UPI00223DBCDA|nr:cerebellin-3-like isoform X2 [Pristis pectinata]
MKILFLSLVSSWTIYWNAASDSFPGSSEISFQEIKDAIKKTKEIDSLKSKVSHLEQEVSVLQKYIPSVIFQAQVSRGRHPSAPRKLVYDQVVVNVGGAYDANTGNFTAPVGGVYSFSYSLLGQKHSRDTLAQLLKNGEPQSYIHSMLNPDQAQTAAMPVLLPLAQGDVVWVELREGITWSDWGSLNFQGFLLQRT